MPNVLNASGSSFYEDKIWEGRQEGEAFSLRTCACDHTHTGTYVVQIGGKSISINIEVSVKRRLSKYIDVGDFTMDNALQNYRTQSLTESTGPRRRLTVGQFGPKILARSVSWSTTIWVAIWKKKCLAGQTDVNINSLNVMKLLINLKVVGVELFHQQLDGEGVDP